VSALLGEAALTFACEGEQLVGIFHPATGSDLASRHSGSGDPASRDLGVVLVVGGPQYRVGSHRQFILLARSLAAAGYSVLRFDVRGMGDSDGPPRNFEAIAPDIRAAVDCLVQRNPGLRHIVLWGLCDGASASLMYAPEDSRITGLVLLNPWVRSHSGIAETYVKHYYVKRLFSGEFWRSLLSGRSRIGVMLRELIRNLRLASQAGAAAERPEVFTERMRRAAERFKGSILLILSGHDLTAQEFESHCARSASWQSVFSRSTTEQKKLEGADHTFSTRQWRDAVAKWTREWLDARPTPQPGQGGSRTP